MVPSTNGTPTAPIPTIRFGQGGYISFNQPLTPEFPRLPGRREHWQPLWITNGVDQNGFPSSGRCRNFSARNGWECGPLLDATDSTSALGRSRTTTSTRRPGYAAFRTNVVE